MSKIQLNNERCTSCGRCVEICPANVFKMDDDFPMVIDEDLCTLCGVCADQCPVNAIVVQDHSDISDFLTTKEGRDEYYEWARTLKDTLGLRKDPVAVRLVRNNEQPPTDIMTTKTPLRHCVSINMASQGAMLHLPAEGHACSAAKAALGIAALPEKVQNGTVPYMHGLASSQEAASRIMEEIPREQLGNIKGTLVSPLENTQFEPDVIILILTPRQAMWVANALLFSSGGPRITANFAGMQASCGDVTVLPKLNNTVNFSVGCYGCRSAGKLDDDEMYVGIPLSQMAEVVSGIRGLQKAMRSLDHSQSG